MSAELQKRKIAEFFTKEKNRLISYVRRWIQDSAERDGEDIVQDVMLNLFDSADITAPVENLSAYIYRSIYNKALDRYRKGRRTTSLDAKADNVKDLSHSDILSDARYDVHNEMEKKELRERIFDAVDLLRPNLKGVFIATELEGRSFRELSNSWDIPINTLLSHKYRAIQKVRSALKNFINNNKE
ncbi:hypothetical protein ES703_106614 [subsurface metagenome]